MRFIPDSQPYVTKVIKEMNIPHKPFLMDEENDARPYLFRDIFVQQKDLKTAGKAAYKLSKEEEDLTPSQVSDLVFEANVPPDQRHLNPDEMMTVDGFPLLHYGTVNIYNLANASDDAHNYVIAGNGYSNIYTNYNAANSIGGTNDTSRGNAYRAPDDGMHTIPLRLAEEFMSLGGRIKKKTTVTAIDECEFPNAQKVYLLTTYNYETLETVQYITRKVVLAVTRSQLKRIYWDALWTSPKRELVDAVISHQAAKIFFAFEEPWWRKESLQYLNLTQGRSISSLPSRQTYYFTAPNPAVSNRSFIMLYNDGQFAKFWEALASDSFNKFPTSNSAIFPMTDTLVKEVVKELALNHNTTEDVIGRPYFGWIMVWDNDLLPRYVEGYGPYMPSESWALWAPGYNYTEETRNIIKLDENQDIFICGSAYSVQQGWTEGALEHADTMLTTHFNIPSYLAPSALQAMKQSFYAKRRVPFYP
ncbi:aplysianin-A-like [Corticium candelabrum]|uniref:aplysianin-A-like n=1 Tax=Corticium candelabrum TaxID=121492 RepID=UPI002E25D9AD|nr:aplysianin-A-like [Corticium candelabrum]